VELKKKLKTGEQKDDTILTDINCNWLVDHARNVLAAIGVECGRVQVGERNFRYSGIHGEFNRLRTLRAEISCERLIQVSSPSFGHEEKLEGAMVGSIRLEERRSF
jgi:hypothetical protein